MIQKNPSEKGFSMGKSHSQIHRISSQNLFGNKKESSHFLLCSSFSPLVKENQTNKKNRSRFTTTPLKAAPKQEVVSITYEEIGLFPRSFSRVLDRFFKQVFSDVENLVIQEYRFYRYLFLTTLKCLFILFFVPFLVNFLAKSYVVRPLTEYFWNTKQTEIFLNSYQQKHAFAELKDFEEKLYFESLIYPKSVNGEEKKSSSFELKPITNTMAPEMTQKSYPYKTPNLDLELKKKQSSNTLFLESQKNNFSPQATVETPRDISTSTVQFDSSPNLVPKIKTVFPVFFSDKYGGQLQNNGFLKKNSTHSFILNLSEEKKCAKETARRAVSSPDSPVLEENGGWGTSPVPFFEQKGDRASHGSTEIKSGNDFITSTCGKMTKISMLRHNLSILNQKSFFHPVAFFFEKGETPVFFKENASVTETFFSVGSNSNDSIDRFSDRFNRESKRPIEPIMSTSTPKTSLFVYQTIEADKNIQQRYQAKTIELAQRYNDQSVEAVTNFFGDIVSLATLFYLLYVLEIQINITQSFLLEVFFGLDDSKKSLLILLITDLLVGYHSSNLWELFFEFFFNHYGLPESQTGIFLLVATLPVLLDVLFKYLIFRHLNRSSPATVATYHAIIE